MLKFYMALLLAGASCFAARKLKTENEIKAWFEDCTNFEEVELCSSDLRQIRPSPTKWINEQSNRSDFSIFEVDPFKVPATMFREGATGKNKFPTLFNAIQYYRLAQAYGADPECRRKSNTAAQRDCFREKFEKGSVDDIVALSKKIDNMAFPEEVRELNAKTLAKLLHLQMGRHGLNDQGVMIQRRKQIFSDYFELEGDMAYVWLPLHASTYTGRNIYAKILGLIIRVAAARGNMDAAINSLPDIYVTTPRGKTELSPLERVNLQVNRTGTVLSPYNRNPTTHFPAVKKAIRERIRALRIEAEIYLDAAQAIIAETRTRVFDITFQVNGALEEFAKAVNKVSIMQKDEEDFFSSARELNRWKSFAANQKNHLKRAAQLCAEADALEYGGKVIKPDGMETKPEKAAQLEGRYDGLRELLKIAKAYLTDGKFKEFRNDVSGMIKMIALVQGYRTIIWSEGRFKSDVINVLQKICYQNDEFMRRAVANLAASLTDHYVKESDKFSVRRRRVRQAVFEVLSSLSLSKEKKAKAIFKELREKWDAVNSSDRAEVVKRAVFNLVLPGGLIEPDNMSTLIEEIDQHLNAFPMEASKMASNMDDVERIVGTDNVSRFIKTLADPNAEQDLYRVNPASFARSCVVIEEEAKIGMTNQLNSFSTRSSDKVILNEGTTVHTFPSAYHALQYERWAKQMNHETFLKGTHVDVDNAIRIFIGKNPTAFPETLSDAQVRRVLASKFLTSGNADLANQLAARRDQKFVVLSNENVDPSYGVAIKQPDGTFLGSNQIGRVLANLAKNPVPVVIVPPVSVGGRKTEAQSIAEAIFRLLEHVGEKYPDLTTFTGDDKIQVDLRTHIDNYNHAYEDIKAASVDADFESMQKRFFQYLADAIGIRRQMDIYATAAGAAYKPLSEEDAGLTPGIAAGYIAQMISRCRSGKVEKVMETIEHWTTLQLNALRRRLDPTSIPVPVPPPKSETSKERDFSSSSDDDSGIGGSSGSSHSKSSDTDDDREPSPSAPAKAENPKAEATTAATTAAASSVFGSTAMLALVGAFAYIL